MRKESLDKEEYGLMNAVWMYNISAASYPRYEFVYIVDEYIGGNRTWILSSDQRVFFKKKTVGRTGEQASL